MDPQIVVNSTQIPMSDPQSIGKGDSLTDALLRNATGVESEALNASTFASGTLPSVVVQVQAPSTIPAEGATLQLSEVPSVQGQEEVASTAYCATTPEEQLQEYKNPRCGPKMAYDAEYKLRAVEFYKQGHSKLETAKRFSVHPRRIREWIAMEEVLKVSPKDRKRVTKRLLNKLNVPESLLIACKSSQPRVVVGHNPAAIATFSTTPGTPDQTCWPYQAQEGTPLSHLEQLANLTSQAVQLSASQGGGGAVMTEPMSTEPENQIEVTSQSPSTPEKNNIAFLKTLSKSEVQHLLLAMNLAKYQDVFLNEQVDGEILSSLGESELLELGVTTGVHRIRFLKLIEGRHSAEDILKVAPEYVSTMSSKVKNHYEE